MSLARAAWITVTAICAIAALLLLVNGYDGYSAVLRVRGPGGGRQSASVDLRSSPSRRLCRRDGSMWTSISAPCSFRRTEA